MAEDRRKAAKSETLTIRLNPRTRFVLEFISRKRGQTITTVVERALETAGEQAVIQSADNSVSTWKDYWDISEGVRALRLAAVPELYPTYEEERRLDFAKKFREYFFVDGDCISIDRIKVDVLWPRIDEFIDILENNKHKDYWMAEKEMRGALWMAKVNPPKSRAGVKENLFYGKPARSDDPDDDIPF